MRSTLNGPFGPCLALKVKRFNFVKDFHDKILHSELNENDQTTGEIRKNFNTNFPVITDDNFLERISWVNLQGHCSTCHAVGTMENVEVHHNKHIRTKRFELIPDTRFVQSQRNRKSIAVCRECHTLLIHKGKYGGTKLAYLAPERMYDNNLVIIEGFISKGLPPYTYTKTLKGWTKKKLTK